QAARTPCFFPKKLRHTGVGACAASKRVSVIAVGGDDVVIVTNGCESAGYNCFLPNVKMTKTPDLLRLILLTGAFFETPNQQHQREHLDFVFFFQAEDGIRGGHVTGVQTCALPIFGGGTPAWRPRGAVRIHRAVAGRASPIPERGLRYRVI